MNKSFRVPYLSFILLLSFVRVSLSQTAFQTDNELVKQGELLFKEEKFVEAYPFYSQLVIRAPQDPGYNYHLGVCTIFSIANKELAIPFLENSLSIADVEKEVYYYLGRAYLLSYRFEDAAIQFKKYRESASPKNIEKFAIEQQIQMCANGSKLVRNINDWVVVEKKELSTKDFWGAYDLSSIGGKLLIKPNEDKFKTPVDLKKKDESRIFLTKDNQHIFFSSYGNDETQGKDIYRITKLPNGKWSKAQALPAIINTNADEEFPFFHPNGKVLYFSSKGHNSMGGYDLFKCNYNSETNSCEKPENLGFPINSPDDDILYAIDSLGKEAYFSSTRSSPQNKISVYKLNMEQTPYEWVIMKGIIIQNRDNQNIAATITVKNNQDNSKIGTYRTNKNSGKYFIVLPNSGNCTFTIECNGFKTQSQTINVPFRFEKTIIGQEMSYDLKTDKLILKTISDNFNEEGYDQLVPSVAKNKALLATESNNTLNTETQPEQTNKMGGIPDSTVNGGILNNDAIIRLAFEDAKELDAEAVELRTQADVSSDLFNQKNDLALKKSNEAQTMYKDALQYTGKEEKKNMLLDTANTAIKEAEQLKQEAAVAYKLSQKMNTATVNKRKEADLTLLYAKALENSAKAEHSPESMAEVAEIEKQLDDINKSNIDTLSIFDSYKLGLENKQKEINKVLGNITNIKREITDNDTLIAKSQLEAENTRNKSFKEALLNEIEGLKQDNIDRRDELKKQETKVNKLKNEYSSIAKESAMAGDVVSMAKKEERITKPNSVVQNKTNTVAVANKPPPIVPKAKAEVVITNSITPSPSIAHATVDMKKVPEKNKNLTTQSPTKTDSLKLPPTALVASSSLTTTVAPIATKTVTTIITNTVATTTVTAIAKSTSTIPETSKATQTQALPIAKIEVAPKELPKTIEKPVVVNNDLKFKAELAEAEKIQSVVDRERAKEAIYKKIAADADAQIAKLLPVYNKETVPSKKADLSAKIKSLENVSKENIALSKKSLVAAEYYLKNNKQTSGELEEVSFEKPQPKAEKPVEVVVVQKTDSAKKPAQKELPLYEIYNRYTRVPSKVELSKNEQFEINSEPVWPIPTTGISKTGLIYTVQVGAFINPIAKGTFGGITPITSEPTGSGYLRYFAGQLHQFASANNVKIQVRDLGFKDAFIVAYYNGKRISLADALKIENGGNPSVVMTNIPNATATITPIKNTAAVNSNTVDDKNNQKPAGIDKNKNVETATTTSTAKTATSNSITTSVTINPDAITANKNATEKTVTTNVAINSESLTATKNTATEKITAPGTYTNTNPVSVNKNALITNETKQVPDISSQNKIAGEQAIPAAITAKENIIAVNGLAYTVQIGVFSSAMPASTFGDITSITSETTDAGYMRYFTGRFNEFASADKVKAQVKNAGFKDAFIVAYYNGKRITLNEAEKIEGGKVAAVVVANTPNQTPAITGNVVKNSTNTTDVINKKNTTTTANNINITETISGANGLFYTVQVGLFSQAMPPETFYHINPIFSETTETGKMRYTVGAYNNLARANEAHQIAVKVGITNAFVNAFYNSKRISLTEARQLEANGANVFTNSPVLNVLPYFGIHKQPEPVISSNIVPIQKSVTTTPVTVDNDYKTIPATDKNKDNIQQTPPVAIAASPDEIVFKVQVGAYKGEVPAEQAAIYLKITSKGIAHYVNDNGLTIYTAGNYKTYAEAEKLKIELNLQYGVKDGFVIAFKNGKKITLSEVKIR